MNSKIFNTTLLVTASIAFYSSQALAGDVYQSPQNSIVAANNEVGLAAVGTLMNYQEHITPGPSDIESGWMPGFSMKYSLMGDYFKSMPSNLYFAVNYQFNSGNISYQGALQDKQPYDGTDSATTNRVLARLGKGFTLNHAMMLTPYIAGGYQSWNRHILGPYGYTEDYHSSLVGAGLMFQYAITPRLVSGVNVEGLAMIGGGMKPHNVPGVPPGYLGSASFGTSGQEKIAADIDYRVYQSWHLYGGLSFTHFNYTGGNLAVPGAFEPLSSTNLFNMSAGLAYQF